MEYTMTITLNRKRYPVKHLTLVKRIQNHCMDIEDKIPWKYNFKWYPLGKDLEKLYNYTDDIKTDWKALLEECKALLIADGIEV